MSRRFLSFLSKVMNEQKFFRRVVLLWAMSLLTTWTFFLMNVPLLTGIGAAGATVVTGVFGILATVVNFYQWHRNKEDEREEKDERHK